MKRFPNLEPYTSLAKSFSCPNCTARGNTLVLTDKGYRCRHCKHREKFTFWHKPFRKLADTPLSLKQAATVINANPSTLRRALMEGRLVRADRKGRRDSLITRDALVTFYLTQFHRRNPTPKIVVETVEVKE